MKAGGTDSERRGKARGAGEKSVALDGPMARVGPLARRRGQTGTELFSEIERHSSPVSFR